MPRSEASREAGKRRSRAWYRDNKDYARACIRARRAKNGRIIDDARSKPCVDCGIQYPLPAMQLDHIYGEKVKPVTGMRGHSEAKIRAEIAKCVVRCANCHAIRTDATRAWQGSPAI